MTVHLRRLAALLACFLLLTIRSSGQAGRPDDPNSLQFEVTSIKRHADGDRGGGGGTLPDGTLRMMNNPLIGILGGAYPSESGEYIGLPDWMRTERYDVILKPPANAAPAPRASTARAAEFRVMMRNMFAQRMKLAAHDEVRDEPTYALGLKLEPARKALQMVVIDHIERPDPD